MWPWFDVWDLYCDTVKISLSSLYNRSQGPAKNTTNFIFYKGKPVWSFLCSNVLCFLLFVLHKQGYFGALAYENSALTVTNVCPGPIVSNIIENCFGNNLQQVSGLKHETTEGHPQSSLFIILLLAVLLEMFLRLIGLEWLVFVNNDPSKRHWTLLVVTQNKCWHKNLLGNEQWRAVDSIKHCEKRLPLK